MIHDFQFVNFNGTIQKQHLVFFDKTNILNF
jgi:hypothetical protein